MIGLETKYGIIQLLPNLVEKNTISSYRLVFPHIYVEIVTQVLLACFDWNSTPSEHFWINFEPKEWHQAAIYLLVISDAVRANIDNVSFDAWFDEYLKKENEMYLGIKGNQ